MEKDEFIEKLRDLFDEFGLAKFQPPIKKGTMNKEGAVDYLQDIKRMVRKKWDLDTHQEALDIAISVLSQPPEVKSKEGWYKFNEHLILNPKLQNYRAGFRNGEFVKDMYLNNSSDVAKCILATDDEVLAAFTTYFRSQGFKEGSRFKSILTGTEHIYREPLLFNSAGNIFCNWTGHLFLKKELTIATLIEEEKIMVGKHEVEFTDGGCIINNSMFDFFNIQVLVSINPIFQKILDRLKSK